MALPGYAVEESGRVATGRRRRRALLLFAGAALIAAGAAVVMLLIPSPTQPGPGAVRSVVTSPDGRIEATVRSFRPALSFDEKTEVTLRLTAGGSDRAEVSFGCVVTDEDARVVFDVRFEGTDALTVDVGGESQTIAFDPRTLRPSALLGAC
jgi:hypothetical protein